MKSFLQLVLVVSLAGGLHATEVPLDVKQSSLKFTGHAFLHDFDGEAKDFSGTAELDAQKPDLVRNATIDIHAPQLTTFESTRDHNMLVWLHSDTNPNIRYELKDIRLLKGNPAQATKDHPAQFHVSGDFTLNKTTKPLETEALGWRESSALIVTGTAKIDTLDYGLPIIKQFFMTVDKQVDVTFRLVFDLPPELHVPAAP